MTENEKIIAAADPAERVINLSDGSNGNKDGNNVSTTPKNPPKNPPKQKVPEINFDVFIPRVKLLNRKSVDLFSDDEVIELALNKLTCDSYKSLKGVEATPAIACWLYLYNTVEGNESGTPDYKLAKAICNLKKDFPGAMKYMLEQIKKKGNGGYDHSELFDLVYKYYFAKEKPKKGTKKDSKPTSAKAPVLAPAKPVSIPEKVKKDEPLQPSLFDIGGSY